MFIIIMIESALVFRVNSSKKSAKGVLAYHSQVEHVVVNVVVLLVYFCYLHAGCQHLLSLGRAEVDGFVGVFLEEAAVDETGHFELRLCD